MTDRAKASEEKQDGSKSQEECPLGRGRAIQSSEIRGILAPES